MAPEMLLVFGNQARDNKIHERSGGVERPARCWQGEGCGSETVVLGGYIKR